MASNRVAVSYKEVGVDIITGSGRYRLGRVQRNEVSTNVPNTPIEELGSNKRVGRIFGTPEVTATIQAIDVGGRNLFAMAGMNYDTVASGSYLEASDFCEVCLATTYKSACTNDISPTLFVEGARLDRISWNYSVGGDSTEEYSFQADGRRFLSYDVVMESGTLSGGSNNQFTFSGTPRQLSDGKYHLAAFINDATCSGCASYIRPDAILTSTETEVTFDTEKVDAGSHVTVVYHTDLDNQWGWTWEEPNPVSTYTDTGMADQPVGSQGWGVEVYLVEVQESPSGVFSTNEKVYRGQSCSIQAAFTLNRVQELGNEDYVGFWEGNPDVTGTLEIIQHDFDLEKKLTGATDSSSGKDLGPTTYGLLVKMYERAVDRTTTPPFKTIWIPQIEVTQETNSNQVGQNSTQTYNWNSQTGEVYIYKGARPV